MIELSPRKEVLKICHIHDASYNKQAKYLMAAEFNGRDWGRAGACNSAHTMWREAWHPLMHHTDVERVLLVSPAPTTPPGPPPPGRAYACAHAPVDGRVGLELHK